MTPRDYRWRVWQGKKCPACGVNSCPACGVNSWLEVFVCYEKPSAGNSVRCCSCGKVGTVDENGAVRWEN